jgi:outer membrane lipase/esterase
MLNQARLHCRASTIFTRAMLPAALLLMSHLVNAQTANNDPKANMEAAVRSICPSLVNDLWGGLGNALGATDSPDKDITLRCNELVQTSNGMGARDLMISSQELGSAWQQVNGEELTATGSLATRASNSQYSSVASRMSALRTSSIGTGLGRTADSGINLEINDVLVSNSTPGWADEPATGGGAAADAMRRWGWFVSGGWNTGDKDRTTLEDGYDFDWLTVTAGFDYSFDRAVVGFALGYDDYSADFDTTADVSGGKAEADGITGTLYGIMYFGNVFVTGSAGYGQMDYDMSRALVYASNNTDPACQCPGENRTLSGSPGADLWNADATVGYEFFASEWLLEPYLGVSYRNADIDGYTESDNSDGGMNLRYDDQDIDSLRSLVGFQVSRAFNPSFGSIRPYVRLDWYHEFDDDAQLIQAKYALEDELAADPTIANNPFIAGFGNCLSCLNIATDDPDEDYFVFGLGVSSLLANRLQLYATYEGLFGYDDLTSNGISLGIRGQF